ncbi:uncharacterized protein LOC120457225 [Drosophila santomea]|uniref:uncharacterized protein LOC120457225 n=1 Tax=Drosophila santomea TaxID=129105 RepID=UPI0019546E20|nr:uncharacterized protein LOC120457225 [Drosophila santomea]
MLPFVQENVPEMLLQPARLAFCANLPAVGRPRDDPTTLVLARNLKFYEFRRKDLVHYIDLKGTKLQHIASQLEGYDGPVCPFLPNREPTDGKLDWSMLDPPEDLPLKFGKFVWQREGIYVLIQCWKHLIVLRRPKDHGANFELVADHRDVVEYQMVEGPIPYQAVVELVFGNGKRQRCDFQEDFLDEEPSTSKNAGLPTQDFESLVQEVNRLQAELNSLRIQNQKDFAHAQDLLYFGSPAERSLLLEEKQPLRRLGDVWTRICGDYFVCGTLLVNMTGTNRLTIVKELYPIVAIEPHTDFSVEHRLYELPLQADGKPPEDYDQLAQFWACQDQHSRRLKWRPAEKERLLPPERSAAMVVRLRLVDLLEAEQLILMAMYEIGEDASPRQIHLITFDVKKLLAKTESLIPTFSPGTLHQDFLAVIMTHTARCSLKLEFQSAQDCASFEQLLVSKLQFELIQVQEAEKESTSDLLDDSGPGSAFQSSTTAADPVQRIFYNRQPQSQWCDILLLRDDPGKHWHVYAKTDDRLRLFQHRLTSDLLQLHCNLNVLEFAEHILSPADLEMELLNSLYEEVDAWKVLSQPADSVEQRREQLTQLHKAQMASDVLASMIVTDDDPQ